MPFATFEGSGTTVKTSVVFLQKAETPIAWYDNDRLVFMAIAKDIGWDSRGRPTHGDDLTEILRVWRHGEGGSTFRLARPDPPAQPNGLNEASPAPTHNYVQDSLFGT